MATELIIIGLGIALGLGGFLIGVWLVRRAYRQSPSLKHYQGIIDILTLRKFRKKSSSSFGGTYESDTKKGGHIEHYEDMRDKLTMRKKPEEIEVESSGGGFGMLSSIIGAFVVILIGVSLLPTISQQVQQVSQQNMNNSSSEMASTMLKMMPLFFGLAIAMVAIAVIAGALRTSGVI